MDAANDIQKTRYQSMCCTKWWILRWNNFLFLTRYPYNAQFIEKYPHLDFSSFFRNEVRMFLHFLPWWRGTWNPVNHLPSFKLFFRQENKGEHLKWFFVRSLTLNILLKCCDCKHLNFPMPCSIVSRSACSVLLKREIVFLNTKINLKRKTLTIVRTAL